MDRPFLIGDMVRVVRIPTHIGVDYPAPEVRRAFEFAGRFTVDRLMSILDRLGARVEVKVKVRHQDVNVDTDRALHLT